MTVAPVSVALCTFNGEQYLGEQLASLSQQTRLPDELVVCDDASTDRTVGLIEQFAATAPFPVRLYVNPTNVGSTKNFEAAIGKCRGEIIVLADQDDVWKPQKIDRLVRFLEDNPSCGFVFSDAEMVDENRRPLGYTLWEAIGFSEADRSRRKCEPIFFELLRRNVVTGATMAFRSVFCPAVLPIPGSWVHDAWIAIIISGIADGGFVEEPLIEYRQHTSQQIGDTRRTLYQQYLVAKSMGRGTFETAAHNFAEAYFRLHTVNGSAPEKLAALEQKAAHCRERCSMRDEGRWRLPLVWKEWTKGRYALYSLGWKAICQDLFLE